MITQEERATILQAIEADYLLLPHLFAATLGGHLLSARSLIGCVLNVNHSRDVDLPMADAGIVSSRATDLAKGDTFALLSIVGTVKKAKKNVSFDLDAVADEYSRIKNTRETRFGKKWKYTIDKDAFKMIFLLTSAVGAVHASALMPTVTKLSYSESDDDVPMVILDNEGFKLAIINIFNENTTNPSEAAKISTLLGLI